MPLDAIRTIARAVPPDAVVFVDEAYAEFSGQTFIPELPAFPNVVVGRTFSKAFGLAGIRIGCLIGAPETLEPIRHAVPVYSVNIAAVVAVQAALDDLAHLQHYLRQVAESKALLYAACDRLGLKYWKSGANFVLVSVGDRARREVIGRRRGPRHLRPRPLDGARLRRLHPRRHRHRRAHAPLHRGHGRGPVRRAVIDRRTKETQIALRLGLDGKGRYQVHTGIRFLDHMLELVRAPRRRSTSRSTPPAISTSTSTTRSRTSASRSAKRCRRRSARAGHQPRRLFRHADGRDAGGRRHRSRRPAARRRRSEGARAARRRSADRARARLLRRLRARRARERARQGAVRPIEPPSRSRRCSRRSPARCASRARRTSAWRGCCRARRACCDRAHRLQGRQPDVGQEGARRHRRRRVHAPNRRARSKRARRSSCRASDTSAPRARSIASGWTRFAPASAKGRPLLGICLGMQWLFEGSDEAPDLPGLGLLAGPLPPARAHAGRRPVKIPHVGWNSLRFERDAPIVDGVPPDAQVYFTHSFVAPVTGDTVAVTEHGEPFAAVVQRGQVAGVQFHPGEVRRLRSAAGRSCATSRSLAAFVLTCCSKRIIACLDVRNGPGRQGHQLRRAAERGRPGGARAALQPRGHRRARHPRHHRDDRRAARAGRHDPRGRARAVHSARRRRRHPHRSRCRGGGRRRRRQGEPEHGGPVATRRSSRRWPSATAARRSSSPSTRKRTAIGSPSTRAADRPRRTATPSNGRARPSRAAPARSC